MRYKMAMLVAQSPRARHRRSRGQSMVETALVLPIFITLLCGCIDFGRYVYVRGTLESDARSAGRQLTLATSQASDCSAWTVAKHSGNGISVVLDPNSTVTLSTSPTAYSPTSSIPLNSGFLFIYPAVATDASVNCNGTVRTTTAAKTVTTRVTYRYQPWTPGISTLIPEIDAVSTSVQPTEY